MVVGGLGVLVGLGLLGRLDDLHDGALEVADLDAGGAQADPATELRYIEQIRKQYYGTIDMAVPVSNEDALAYGMDSTPTLVLIDRAGKVAMYHPGRMTREELDAAIRPVVAAKPPPSR